MAAAKKNNPMMQWTGTQTHFYTWMLIFLLLLLGDRNSMGSHVNTKAQNIVNWAIVLVLTAISTLLGVNTLFPSLFGGQGGGGLG